MIIECIKCKEEFEYDSDSTMTSGFYKDWFGYDCLCDHCMWRTEEYLRDYGAVICLSDCEKCIKY